MKRLLLLLSLASSFLVTTSASAQYYPGYRPPYGAPYVNPYYPNSTPGYNYLNGSADVMKAYGTVINDQEKARVERENANQAKLKTKRMAFDEAMYEKANTPTYTEELSKETAMLLTRLMNNPIKSEITEGKTLNAMLPLLQSMSTQGTQGQPVPLSQSMINRLNISSSGSSSTGMLRAGGQVEWPIALRGKQQQKIDKLLASTYDAAVKNTLEPKQMKELRTEMKNLREDMRKKCANDEIESSSYMRALDFYHALEKSIDALERPDARKELAGAYSPRARNVQELVDFMTDNGVKFAPATPGDETAYQATHDAFVRYARTAQSSAGFTSMNAPIPGGKKK